ncbi:hypothetical protein HanIR_Chr09g0391301 [Helianthus annuus]|nr:hypothetical protein HanIR_Chr09g0391301 [Helianthus annuus]
MCDLQTETTNHLLISCGFAQQVWVAISLWIKTPLPRYLLSVVKLMEFIRNMWFRGHKKKEIYMIMAATSWSLWMARNKTIFNNKASHVYKIIGEIKAPSFLWISSRAAPIKADWTHWGDFSLNW